MRILFFASVAEVTGTSETQNLNAGTTDELRQKLQELFPGIEKLKYTLAVNKEVVTGNLKLSESDEVAVLPPFSGG